jgi:hypothetical protein
MEIRLATSADRDAVRALAGRDSAPVPAGDLLLAWEGGRLLAALPLDGRAVIADPFEPTMAAVAALRAYSQARTAMPARAPLRPMAAART